jgi:hypothetical protein
MYLTQDKTENGQGTLFGFNCKNSSKPNIIVGA